MRFVIAAYVALARPFFSRGFSNAIPSALMREARVVGFTSSNSAAPPRPNTLPPQDSSAARILARSRSRRSSSVSSRSAGDCAARRCCLHRRHVDAQPRVPRQDRGALDHVLQFAHVAGPVVLHQAAHVAFGQLEVALELAALALHEMRRQERDVVAAFAQRNGIDREHVEPEIEVLAEAAAPRPPALRSRLVAAITRTSTVRVCVSPTRSKLLSCSTRSSFPCSVERHLGDLVEEQRAAVGQLEAADAVARRAGEARPRSWPKNSLSNSSRGMVAQLTRISGRRLRLLASWMARAISSLPVPDLAGDQHGGVGRRHQLDLSQHLLDRGAAPDNAVVVVFDADFLLQVGVLELQALAQAVDLLVRGAQLLVGLAPLGDVAEHDHRADHVAALADRRRGVLDPERGAVLAPEHLGVDLMHRAVAERGVDRAIVLGIARPVRMGVVHDRMHVVPDQLLGFPAEHALGGRVHERGLAVGVDAVDAFAGGAQDELVHRLTAEIEGDSRGGFCSFCHHSPVCHCWP